MSISPWRRWWLSCDKWFLSAIPKVDVLWRIPRGQPKRFPIMIVFLIGVLGVLVSVFLQAVFTSILISAIKNHGHRAMVKFGTRARPFIIASTACALTLKHAVDIALWAAAFWFFAGPQFDDFEATVYFSSVTYTSLGYGDVVVTGRWRLLCGMEAISGTILFGLSTAMLFVLIDLLWLRPERERQNALRGE